MNQLKAVGNMRRQTLVDSIYAIIHERITSGYYPKGGQLPAEVELISEFGTSRTTIRAAIDRLISKSMVFRKHGVGTFVANTGRIVNPIDEFRDFEELIRSNGFEPQYHRFEAKLAALNADIIDNLDLKNDQRVLKVSKYWTANENPVVFCTNYLPLWVFPEVVIAKIIAGEISTEPIFSFFDDYAHIDIVNYVATLECGIVSNCEFHQFKQHFGATAPMLIINQIGTDINGMRVHYSKEYHPDNLMKFSANRSVKKTSY